MSKADDDDAADAQADGMDGVVSGATMKVERIAWLWPGMIVKGALNLIDGQKGTGKSSILAAMAATVCGGKCLPESKLKLKKSSCLWFGSEESFTAAVLPRWKANGGDVKNLYTVMNTPTMGMNPLTLPASEGRLRGIVEEKNVSVIVLDPYSSLSSPMADLRNEQQCRDYLQSLARVCAELGVTALLARHFRKGRSGGFLETRARQHRRNRTYAARWLRVGPRTRITRRCAGSRRWRATTARRKAASPTPSKGNKDSVFKAVFGKRTDMTI